MSEYHFDGTNVKFRFTICDASGLVPQPGMATGAAIAAYDSAKASDAIASATITEVSGGVYEANVLYSELNRAAGDGVWSFVLSHSNPDLTFRPPAVHIQISRKIGTVTATVTPTTTTATFTGLGNLTTNHYVDSLVKVIKSPVSGNVGELKKITASVANAGEVQLTFKVMSVAPSVGDMVELIDR